MRFVRQVHAPALIAACLALLLAACVVPAAPPEASPMATPTEAPAATATPALLAAVPLTVTDALGRQVTFERLPERIALAGRAVTLVTDAVYLFPAARERVVVLGQPQGSKDFLPVIEPAVKDKLQLTVEAGPEQIAAGRPDLAILKSYMADRLGNPLESLGIPVVYVDLETPEQYWRDLRTLGVLLGDPARSEEIIAFYQERVDRVVQATADIPESEKPDVLLLYYSDRDGQVAFNVPPLTWIQTTLVRLAGGEPVWQDVQLGSGWTKVSLEQIAAWDADQIYIVAYTTSSSAVVERLKADPQWQALTAVRQGRLYAFPADFYSWDQPDPRWILGLMWLAGKIHPDRLPDLDMAQEIRTFYREMYRLDEAAYRQSIEPTLVGDLP